MNKYLKTHGQQNIILNRDGVDFEVSVEWKFHPGMKGKRDEYGQQLEPDDLDKFEILRAVDMDNFEVDLTKEEEDKIMEELNELELIDYKED